MLSTIFLALGLSFQNPSDCLCEKNENIVFSFQTKNNKMVSVCSEKQDKYLVYRFGTKTKIEMQYPSVLDKSSWQKFEHYSYFRGGGEQNAGIDENHLSFTNSNIKYTVFQDYTAESNQIDIGISVELPSKTVEIKGVLKTKKGDLAIINGKVPKSDF
jgi:hypothetical protein